MHLKPGFNQRILITGGTSGLGLELVKLFLGKGFNVIATGRNEIKINDFADRFTFCKVDFGDLSQVAGTIRNVCRNHNVSIVINNAGILSPPEYTETADGLEYTFQINFLAHLLADEIILKSARTESPLLFVSVTSPVYRFAGIVPYVSSGSEDYSAVRSYSSSKFYLAMMNEFLGSGNEKAILTCIGFDPGTFSSSIYRMQKGWFRIMYRIASPFMRSPAKVAKALADILLNADIENGMVYDISKRSRTFPELDRFKKDAFIKKCFGLIDKYLE